MTSSATIVERLVIPHPAFAEAERQIEQCFAFAAAKGEAEGLAVIGESGTGKTSVLQSFASKYKPSRTDDGMHVPVLFTSVPSSPTVKSLTAAMLEALGTPDPERGTIPQMESRLRILMKETGTRLVMIDEFQHFVDQGTHKVMHSVADSLKRLIDDTRSTLVIAGLPSSMAVIDQNVQLARRFMAPVQMTRFQWGETGHRRQFMSILRSYYKEISREFDLPDLSSEDMAFRFYLATGGLMGYVAKLLRQALRNAASRSARSIALKDLHIAHIQSVWSVQRDLDLPRPFGPGFQACPTADIFARANRIGTVPDHPAAPARRESRRKQDKSLSDVLAAH